MRKITTFFLALISTLLFSLPSHAGSWQLDHYVVSMDSVSQGHYYTHESVMDNNDHTFKIINQKDKVTNSKEYGRDEFLPFSKNYPPSEVIHLSGNLRYAGRRFSNNPEFQMKSGSSFATMTVTPYFKWHPSTTGEEPTPEFWIVETGIASATFAHNSLSVPYTEQNRYVGENFSYSLLTGLEVPGSDPIPASVDYPGQYNYVYRGARYSVSKSETICLTPNGATIFPGPSRTLSSVVTSPGWNVTSLGEDHFGSDPSATATPYVRYYAQVAGFSLNVSVFGEYARMQPDHPRSHNIWAYSGPTRTLPNSAAPAGKFYWNGGASYDAAMSSTLASNMGNVTYNWMERGSKSVYLLPPDISQPPTDEQKPETSTQRKNFAHQLTDFADGTTVPWSAEDPWKDSEPHHTKVTVAVQSDNPEKPILKAKTSIDWKRDPSTQYEATVTYMAYDSATGETFSIDAAQLNSQTASIMGSLPTDIEEVRDLDGQATQIRAVKKATFETGRTLVKGALEAQMMVFSWYVPDETDFLIPGLGKALKAKKMGVLFGQLMTGVQRLNRGTLDAAKEITGRPNLLVWAKVRLRSTGKAGTLKNGDKFSDLDKIGETMKGRCWFGEACFIKGTSITMGDGTLKTIEEIKIGDIVSSKHEYTGEIGSKSVSQVFERKTLATLILSFSNGEKIETTAEHPFYVEGEGFLPAGLIAIGNSIVTRAGPKIDVTDIEKRSSPQTVYNFTVNDFHSYFVGKSQFWVHNAEYKPWPNQMEELFEEEMQTAAECGAKVVSLNSTNWFNELSDLVAGGGHVKWVVTMTGELKVGRFSLPNPVQGGFSQIKHPVLTGHKGPVIAAGEGKLVLKEGKIILETIQPLTGHYKCNAGTEIIAAKLFQDKGVEIGDNIF